MPGLTHIVGWNFASSEWHCPSAENDLEPELTQSFEPDDNDPELQKQGWQAILNNFKAYVDLAEKGDSFQRMQQ